MPTTTVSRTEYEDENGKFREQYRTTIPKGLAEAMGLAGKRVDWRVVSANTLQATIVDRGDGE